MSIRNLFLAAGALTLAAAPVAAAAANPAASLSIAPSVRAASSSDKASKLEGGLFGVDYVIIAMVIIAGVAIYAIVEDQSDDPTSP